MELVHLPEAAGDDMVLVGAVLLIVGPHMPEVLKCRLSHLTHRSSPGT